MKNCRKCGKNKANSSYSKNSYSKDGLQSYCKDCQKWYNKNKKSSRVKEDNSQNIISMKVKKCSQCKEEKPLIEFARDSYAKTGYRCYCKKCAKYHKKPTVNSYSNEDNKNKIELEENKKMNKNTEIETLRTLLEETRQELIDALDCEAVNNKTIEMQHELLEIQHKIIEYYRKKRTSILWGLISF